MSILASSSKEPRGMVTAISSSLSKRAATTVPPASNMYEPMVKSILARKFVYDVLSVSAAVSWPLAVAWTWWQRGGIGSLGIFGGILNWISPLTLLSTVLWWSLACVPSAILRKVFLQATYSPSLSPRQALFRHAAERPYQYALVIALTSSTCLTICHALASQTVERYSRGDPKLGIWAGSRKHPYHLNGNLCFLFLSQLIGASFYWLRDALKDRFSIRWSNQENQLIQPNPILSSPLVSIVLLSVTSTVCSLTSFAVLRSIILPILYQVPFIHSLIRPFVAHFLRPTYTLSFVWTHSGLVARAFFLTLTNHILWEVPSSSFDTVFSCPVSTIDALKDPGLVLVSGIHSGDKYFQLHAFQDLCLLASSEDQMVAKRAIIYNDSKHSPTLWSALVRRSLLLLGADYQLFLRRGNPPPPTPAPPVPAIKQPEVAPTTPVIRTQIYKTPQVTAVDRIADTLASDSAIAGVLAGTTGDSVTIPGYFGKTLRLRLSSQLSPLTSSVNVVKSSISTSSHLMPWSSLPTYDLGIWWARERRDRAAMRSLPNRELDLIIIEVLSKLVGHSLKEDLLGYVQRDIACILEAMASFLLAIEEYQFELSKSMPSNEPNSTRPDLIQLAKETAMAGEWLHGLAEGLRNGISLIVRTFGDRLAKYKFNPKIAAKLQIFADYI